VSTLTNEAIDQMWAEAEAQENERILALIQEIDTLKRAQGALAKRYRTNKQIWMKTASRATTKSFHRGQSYIRGKIAKALADAGMKDAAKLALDTHVDYDIRPTGRFSEP